MARDRRHIIVQQGPSPDPYSRHNQRIEKRPMPPPSDPVAHGLGLSRSMQAALDAARTRRATIGVSVPGLKPGMFVQFRSFDDVDLKLESLDARGSGIELVAASHVGEQEWATVFVPDGKVKHFLTRFTDYAGAQRTKTGERKNRELVERIAEIQLATLRALWTDPPDTYPQPDEQVWWEVWLRVTDGNEEERLATISTQLKLPLGSKRLTFPDRIVRSIRATAEQLGASIDVLNDVAELRRLSVAPGELLELTTEDHAEWVTDLAQRTTPAGAGAPAICVLDTGVNRGHALLQSSLGPEDLHAVDPLWGTADHDGHGTEMAGLAIYGDLTGPLASRSSIRLLHRLESVKILPPVGHNREDLYGAITAEAVARVEVQAPRRPRSFSMSIGAGDGEEHGKPTSWSAALDALAAGRSFDPTTRGLEYIDDAEGETRRLFVVSAGNVGRFEVDHLAQSDTETIQDPGQAWNALTVGASTELVTLDAHHAPLKPVARHGDLSPYSATSLLFEAPWPIKPDVVFEGGNLVHDGTTVHDQIKVLSPVSTFYKPAERLIAPSWATSAATAQVARFAGVLAAEYPGLWPETIRALIVHSAEWTKPMWAYAPKGATRGKRERELLRRFGFGVPDLDRARRSATNALTLVVQDTLRPFSEGKLREMKMHELPWPADELAALGATEVRLRITLSYFIEPNPARRGWRTRYRYASHGLRFEAIGPTDSVADFKKWTNKRALDEEEKRPSRDGDSDDWTLGTNLRHHGSLHADLWHDTAAELARRSSIGVFPVSGWWKDQPKHDRSERGVRYALVISIDSPREDVDLWTPVATEVGIPIAIEIV